MHWARCSALREAFEHAGLRPSSNGHLKLPMCSLAGGSKSAQAADEWAGLVLGAASQIISSRFKSWRCRIQLFHRTSELHERIVTLKTVQNLKWDTLSKEPSEGAFSLFWLPDGHTFYFIIYSWNRYTRFSGAFTRPLRVLKRRKPQTTGPQGTIVLFMLAIGLQCAAGVGIISHAI